MQDGSKQGGDPGEPSAEKLSGADQSEALPQKGAGEVSPDKKASTTPDLKPGKESSPAVEKPAKPEKKPAVMETVPWEGALPDDLRERFGDKVQEFLSYREQHFLIIELSAAVPLIEYLKIEKGFDYLVDITAVDDPNQEKRFELIWILYSFASNERIRIKARAAEGVSAATAVGVHLAADWLEREVFDMFGIRFDGHPNMTRILLPEEWQGYPLRKDYSIIQQDEDWVRENLQIESGQ